jgi:hypothetical protein
MTADLPDTICYPLEEAREMLSSAGVEGVEVLRVGRSDEAAAEKRAMVIRQRTDEDGGVELTVAAEWRTPMRSDAE